MDQQLQTSNVDLTVYFKQALADLTFNNVMLKAENTELRKQLHELQQMIGEENVEEE